MTAPISSPPASPRYRRLLLVLLVIGAGGLLLELLLLEHFDEPWQWAPLVTLVLTLVASAAVAARPRPATIRFFQVVMVACIVFGAIGLFLHVAGNLEFELESSPDLRGWPLYWAAVRGAVPALAPGALLQLGLLGLLFAYRHPALTRAPASSASIPQESAR